MVRRILLKLFSEEELVEFFRELHFNRKRKDKNILKRIINEVLIHLKFSLFFYKRLFLKISKKVKFFILNPETSRA